MNTKSAGDLNSQRATNPSSTYCLLDASSSMFCWTALRFCIFFFFYFITCRLPAKFTRANRARTVWKRRGETTNRETPLRSWRKNRGFAVAAAAALPSLCSNLLYLSHFLSLVILVCEHINGKNKRQNTRVEISKHCARGRPNYARFCARILR